MRLALATVALSLLAAGCVGPRPAPPLAASVAPPDQWRRGEAGSNSAVAANWWTTFGDPVLDELVTDALAHNDDIAIAAARVEEARARFADARGQQLPTVNSAGAGARSQSVNAFGQQVEQWAAQGEVRASYDLDLFGRLKSSAEAARAQLLASEYSHETVRLAIASSVASGYIQLRLLDARLIVLRKTLDARAASLALIRRRVDAGYGTQLELAQAEAEYEAAAQQIPAIELAIAKQENGLSILLGRPPADVGRGSDLPDIEAPIVPATLPAALLRQRPDLAAAEQQVVAADRSLDAARAAFMPDISLSASGGFVASSLLSGDPLSVFSIGGSILAPIFNGGRLQAQADGAAARRDQAAFTYRRAALIAFREVEDGMAAERYLGSQERAITAQRDALARALKSATSRYREGYSPYLEQLDAERGLLASELALLQIRGDRLQAMISLFQALGGGWSLQ